jgi:hypothetical protein
MMASVLATFAQFERRLRDDAGRDFKCGRAELTCECGATSERAKRPPKGERVLCTECRHTKALDPGPQHVRWVERLPAEALDELAAAVAAPR